MPTLTRLFFTACLALPLSPTFADGFRSGEITEFAVDLTIEQRRAIAGGRLVRTDRALCAIALPPDFDPALTWPILIVSSTSDPGYNSSRLWLRERYAETALAAGWIVLAADPPTPQPPNLDTPQLRYVLASAALDELARTWPGFAEWPLAFAGFSGGSKQSVHLAAQFARHRRVAIGLFLGGCNSDVSAVSMNIFSPPRRAFRGIPVFVSGGETDDVAPLEAQHKVVVSLRGNGFRHVRYETYPAGHVFHPPHLAAALAWFTAPR